MLTVDSGRMTSIGTGVLMHIFDIYGHTGLSISKRSLHVTHQYLLEEE